MIPTRKSIPAQFGRRDVKVTWRSNVRLFFLESCCPLSSAIRLIYPFPFFLFSKSSCAMCAQVVFAYP